MIALKTHTDIDIVKEWSLEKQLGWIYALSELYNKDEQAPASTTSVTPQKPAAPRSTPIRSDLPGGVFTRKFVVGKDGYVTEHTSL